MRGDQSPAHALEGEWLAKGIEGRRWALTPRACPLAIPLRNSGETPDDPKSWQNPPDIEKLYQVV
jgi:hypothetical protein